MDWLPLTVRFWSRRLPAGSLAAVVITALYVVLAASSVADLPKGFKVAFSPSGVEPTTSRRRTRVSEGVQGAFGDIDESPGTYHAGTAGIRSGSAVPFRWGLRLPGRLPERRDSLTPYSRLQEFVHRYPGTTRFGRH
jgi:hypothetical protein